MIPIIYQFAAPRQAVSYAPRRQRAIGLLSKEEFRHRCAAGKENLHILGS
jgi:hypothetical protein